MLPNYMNVLGGTSHGGGMVSHSGWEILELGQFGWVAVVGSERWPTEAATMANPSNGQSQALSLEAATAADLT